MKRRFVLDLATSILLTGLCTTASVLKVENLNALHERATNPCLPDGNPALYKEYRSDICPAKYQMDDKGNCGPEYNKKDFRCVSFCEVRQEFTYEEEQPVPNTYCHGPLTCLVSETTTTTWTYDGHVNVGWSQGLQAGITGGLSYASATTTTRTTSVVLKDGECGYFTFLPIVHHSCGTYTVASSWREAEKCLMDTVETLQNLCIKQMYRPSDGSRVRGDTIFVWTDCGTRARLPMDKQSEAYRHEGVAAPQSIVDNMFKDVYTPGWCTAHVTQWQKHEYEPSQYQNDDFVFVVCIFDGSKEDPKPINLCDKEHPDKCCSIFAPTGQQQKMPSKLPYPLLITAGAKDRDDINFEYNGAKWTSRPPGAKCGGFEDENAECNMGWTC